MKPATARKPKILIAVVETDPLRLIGLRALFDTESDFELTATTLSQIANQPNIDIIMLGAQPGQNLFDVMAGLKAARPDLRIIVTGTGADDESILKAVAAGAKVLWLQLGIASRAAGEIAAAAGLSIVMNKCLAVEAARA